jgi:hypothetical protein
MPPKEAKARIKINKLLEEAHIPSIIFAYIKREQSLVIANKKLIEVFEGRIKEVVARVWGE